MEHHSQKSNGMCPREREILPPQIGRLGSIFVYNSYLRLDPDTGSVDGRISTLVLVKVFNDIWDLRVGDLQSIGP